MSTLKAFENNELIIAKNFARKNNMFVTSIFYSSYEVFKRQILDSFKLIHLADVTFQFVENGGEFFKRGENSLRAYSFFPQLFSKDMFFRHVKTKVCLGKG